jgi:hypothetical protein
MVDLPCRTLSWKSQRHYDDLARRNAAGIDSISAWWWAFYKDLPILSSSQLTTNPREITCLGCVVAYHTKG